MKTVTIELDKPRSWAYNMGTLRIFEETTGKSMMDIDWDKPYITDMLSLIYAGLKKADKEITMDFVEDNLDINQLESIFAAIEKVISAKK